MPQLTIDITNSHLGFDFAINQSLNLQGILGVFGHSGSGKTTLLNTIAGLNSTSAGQVLFNNSTWLDNTSNTFIQPEKRNVSLVFQDARLFPHLNVIDNLKFAVKRCQSSQLKFDDIIELTQISHLLTKSPEEISAGEKQRVALARAILAEPQLLLLDEPLSALDQTSKIALIHLLKTVHQQLALPMIYVSHNLDEIQQLANQLLVLNQGKVTHLGDVHQIIHQLNHTGKIQQQTSLSLAVCVQDDSHGLTKLQLGDQYIYLLSERVKQQTTQLRCYIFANEISLTTTEANNSSIVNQLKAQIIDITTNQHQVLVQLACHGQNFFASISSYSLEKLALAPKQWVFMQFKASAVRT
ncbi:molybdenum ABC transporter ATP-binding protein [Thalassotalea sp. G2M2-11]|uniref:molybdenum ABC transporter ATP-binding protein n=1 Tax=Thalassotalea sp. G2M2-11 TaxID=2787627 RepID=UPI0019D284B0|nr:molybdenum ABC transporter ATP-binding protein [Thalassotalea sp. G2M2-11]